MRYMATYDFMESIRNTNQWLGATAFSMASYPAFSLVPNPALHWLAAWGEVTERSFQRMVAKPDWGIHSIACQDGRDHLVLNCPLAIDAPVRLLQGMRDLDVPYQHAFRLMKALTGTDVVAQFIKDGDHRLSTDSDLARLCATVATLSDEVTAA